MAIIGRFFTPQMHAKRMHFDCSLPVIMHAFLYRMNFSGRRQTHRHSKCTPISSAQTERNGERGSTFSQSIFAQITGGTCRSTLQQKKEIIVNQTCGSLLSWSNTTLKTLLTRTICTYFNVTARLAKEMGMISLVFNQKTKASDMAGKFRDNSEDRGTTKDRMVRRIPLSVYKKIEKLADENEMSVNSYLVKILADHVERDLKKKHNKNKK